MKTWRVAEIKRLATTPVCVSTSAASTGRHIPPREPVNSVEVNSV